MTDIYRALQSQARFWDSAWQRKPSKVRGPGYGYSGGKRPVGRRDLTLTGPALPKATDLALKPVFGPLYAELLAGLAPKREQNDRLIAHLQANLGKVRRNRYNLEVLLSLAYFQGHFPGHPIMPAVLIIEAMAQVGGVLLLNTVDNPEKYLVYFTRIDNARFRKPVIPGDQIRFEVELVEITGK